jgi:hypothetical protein
MQAVIFFIGVVDINSSCSSPSSEEHVKTTSRPDLKLDASRQKNAAWPWPSGCSRRVLMKTFLVLVLTVTALFLWQRNSDQAVESTTPVVNRSAPAPVSEHDWPKNSLDSARRVANQVRAIRAQNEQP